MPVQPVYVQTDKGTLREWQDITELKKAGTEELRAWLWFFDPNGDFDDMSKRDMIYLIVLELQNSYWMFGLHKVHPGSRKDWPAWFQEEWDENYED